MPSLSLTTPEEVNKLFQAINPNRAAVFDNIPPKLVKVAAEAIPFSQGINNSILKGVI